MPDSRPQVKETYGHTRGITLPYDKDAVTLGMAAREMFVKTFKKEYPGCESGKWKVLWNYSDIGKLLPGRNDYDVTLLNPGQVRVPPSPPLFLVGSRLFYFSIRIPYLSS